ncbi:MAG: hypothetical protein HC879_10080 [Leptolyngbyaceae cyanobacterium SL_5_9]|nr:hypothetical protein [Leptolyngbyaceae cyanobacterium SL_5_9]NJO73270.1 hypothetical protein [Leptolyngbyaceae cyanobacterium RM1_406_9]
MHSVFFTRFTFRYWHGAAFYGFSVEHWLYFHTINFFTYPMRQCLTSTAHPVGEQ